jgi:hypothetical protein
MVLHTEKVEAFPIGLSGETAYGLDFVGGWSELDAES